VSSEHLRESSGGEAVRCTGGDAYNLDGYGVMPF